MADVSVPSIATATPAATETVVGVTSLAAVKRFSIQDLVNAGVAAVTPTGGTMAVTGAFSATGLISGAAGVQFRGADATAYEMLRYIGGANNPGLFVKATEATKVVELYASGSAGGEVLRVGSVVDFSATGIAVTGVASLSGDTFTVTTPKTPASAAAAGTVGNICWDASYIYVATGANTWKRVAIATW